MKKIDWIHWRGNLLQSPLIALAIAGFFAILLVLNSLSTWQLLSNPPETTPQIYQAPITVDLTQLSNLHIMGADNNGDLPLASLGVTLIGIFLDTQSQSTALIALKSGDNQVYKVGDSLAPGIDVEKILSDSVIVRHNGRLEKLALPIEPILFAANLPNSGLWH